MQAFTGNAIGALTFSFIEAMETESKLTYGKLLNSMRRKVYLAQEVVGRIAPFASSKSQVFFVFIQLLNVSIIRITCISQRRGPISLKEARGYYYG